MVENGIQDAVDAVAVTAGLLKINIFVLCIILVSQTKGIINQENITFGYRIASLIFVSNKTASINQRPGPWVCEQFMFVIKWKGGERRRTSSTTSHWNLFPKRSILIFETSCLQLLSSSRDESNIFWHGKQFTTSNSLYSLCDKIKKKNKQESERCNSNLVSCLHCTILYNCTKTSMHLHIVNKTNEETQKNIHI